MMKQNKEAILESGRYVHLEILIGKNNELPYSHIECKKAGAEELAILIRNMEEAKKAIIEKDPLTLIALSKTKVKQTIVKDSDKEGYSIMKGGEE